MKKAGYWKTLSGGDLVCRLCPHACRFEDGDVGICNARKRKGDALYSMNYGRATSMAVDPIEKKPLYHFHPGSKILSIGSFGCNFKCPFCQNADISQGWAETFDVTPESVVNTALAENSIGVAYTYNEPMIWMEFMVETARLAREKGLKNVVVTNGFVTRNALEDLLPVIDAANVDLKSMEDSFYRNICSARLAPVLDTCVKMKRAGVHLEVTNLVVTGGNDREENFVELADWIYDNLGEETPVHLSAYFPTFMYSAPPTSRSTLERAREILGRKIKRVHLGNLGFALTDKDLLYNDNEKPEESRVIGE